MTDVLVAGGGPVGLATALYARRAGLDVSVWEPRADVIDKACGEGLMPAAVDQLTALGVDPPGQRLDGIRYLDERHQAQADFRRGHGRGVRRTTLHGALRDAVMASGIPIVHRAVRELSQREDGVDVGGVGSRYLIAADGLHSPTRRLLGLEGRASPLRRYGLRRHVVTEPWTSYVEVHWAPSCEAYVTPVARDQVGIAILTSHRGSFDRQVQAFPRLLARLDGREVGPVHGAGPLRMTARRRVAGRVLLVGDAAGYVDALTGEGIALGLAQACAAVDAVAAGRPEQYERAWLHITRRHRMLTRALLTSSQVRPVRRALVPAAHNVPGLFAAAVNLLARPA